MREKLLYCLEKEIPHGTAVVVTKFSEREDTEIIDLDVTIYCEKDSHKGIIIGKKRRDAKENRWPCAYGYRKIYGHKGLFTDVGQGKGQLARQ